jgi:hypothetical protein
LLAEFSMNVFKSATTEEGGSVPFLLYFLMSLFTHNNLDS